MSRGLGDVYKRQVEKPGIYRDIYNIQMQSADRALLEEGGSEHGSH